MGVTASAVSRVTGVDVSYKNFNAGKAAMLAQRLAILGCGNANIEYSLEKFEVESATDVAERFGYGSPLHLACRQLFPISGGQAAFPVTVYPVAKGAAGTAATGAFGVAGTATEAGTAKVTVNGTEVSVFIALTDSASQVAAKIATEITAITTLPVSAVASGDNCNLTAKTAGAAGNNITLGVDSASQVAGITITTTAMAGGVDGAGVAECTVSVSGTATEAGSGTIYIGGIAAEFAIAKDATAANLMSAIVSAINGTLEMPVVAALLTGTPPEIKLTAKCSGTIGNQIKVAWDCDVAGLTFVSGTMTGGSVDGDIEVALAKVGNVWETMVLDCYAYTDTAKLDKYQTFGEGRWGWQNKKPVLVAHGCTDDYATRTAITDLRPNDHINFLVTSVGSRELPFVIAAKAMISDIMTTANENPPVNYKGLLTGLHAGADGAQETWQTRNNSVLKGASTNIKEGSVARLNDVITFYHPASEGKYPSWRYVVDAVKLMNVVYNVRLILEADEMVGVPLIPDEDVVTNKAAVQPKTVRAALVTLTNSLVEKAILADAAFTKENLEVTIDSENPKRLNVVFPVKLSGNIEVASADVYFGFYLG